MMRWLKRLALAALVRRRAGRDLVRHRRARGLHPHLRQLHEADAGSEPRPSGDKGPECAAAFGNANGPNIAAGIPAEIRLDVSFYGGGRRAAS